jgi:hypothetical protein
MEGTVFLQEVSNPLIMLLFLYQLAVSKPSSEMNSFFLFGMESFKNFKKSTN